MWCADFHVVGLVAVANGNGQGAGGQTEVHLAVIDEAKFKAALAGQAEGGGTDPDLRPATIFGVDNGATADRPVERCLGAVIVAINAKQAGPVEQGYPPDASARISQSRR